MKMWRGKRIDSMTREELIMALEQLGVLYSSLLGNNIKKRRAVRTIGYKITNKLEPIMKGEKLTPL